LPAAAALVAAALVLSCGCGEGPSDPPSAAAVDAEPEAAATTLEDRELWEVFRIGETRVGYGRTIIRTEGQGGADVVRIEGLNRLKFRRAGRQIALGVDFASRQTPGGELIDFEASISQGPRPIQQTRGKVVGDKLEMDVTTLGKTVSSSIPWQSDFCGPLAPQLDLMRNPLKPGEKRTVHELMPAANVVCRTEMAAAEYEPVDVLGQTHDLLRIDLTTTLPGGQVQRSTAWMDGSGDVLRSHQEAMNMESFRASKEAALASADRAEFDMVLGLSVGVDLALENPHETRRIRYRLTLDGGNPADVFPSGLTQEVRSIDENTAEVTVYAVRPEEAGGGQSQDGADGPPQQPGPHDLESNSLVQSDDAEIAAAARQVAAGEKTTWQAALALERYAHDKITSSNYSQAFDSAAAVMKTGEGDCTEHAVLLAALARASKIPARVVIGLVYTNQTGRPTFGYHMWDELYIGDRWIPMDATLGSGGIGAAHLKLAHSSLEGASALSSFLPVAQVAGRLRIEIEEVE
jgi:hypothetical protein